MDRICLIHWKSREEWDARAARLRTAQYEVLPVLEFTAFRPLIYRKLGIKEDSRVGLFDAPPDFEATLGELPAGARTTRSPDLGCDVTIWFVMTLDELHQGMAPMAPFAGAGKRFWIAWPKKSSGVRSDLSDAVVRSAGLDAGLVDYKVCSIDSTWSAYCFAVKK